MAGLETIGFIGLGNMGAPIALRLLRVGYPMTVLDLVPDRMEPHIREGANPGSSPMELARDCDVVIASLHAEAVREVALGERGIVQGGKEGQVFINLSTTSPELAVSVADALRERGIEMLDAPVSGAAVGAQSGHLTVFVGGNYEAYERSLPVLQQVGRTVTYLGENGKGQIGKRINGAMEALSQLAVYEGMLLARKMNLDLKAFSRAAAGGCAQSWRLDELVREFLLKGEEEFRFHLQRSRTTNALQMAKSVGITLHGVEAAHRVFAEHDWQIVVDFKQ